MYPLERYMKICKGYVQNRNRLEGCITECYIAKEVVEFLAEIFIDDKIVGIPSATHKEDKPTSGATIVSVYGKLFDQAHLCVLQNTDEFINYFVEHLEYLKREFPKLIKNEKWLTGKQNKTFADWLKERVSPNSDNVYGNINCCCSLNELDANIPDIVRWLSDKPSNEVLRFSGYRIAGV
ncbi:uncharacterized protein LOC121050904 [Rosa chinensis]|uniref:uncharacterized protein LOC121050904 n=1 Tax=Rosa chinensis TaxID=74649 RepID=UPI001AD8AABA|nr:uncharacterized protein LOC121050904 [Rosa chinensis]